MKILSAEFIKSAPRLRDCPDFGIRSGAGSDPVPEFVLVGRSNVGKSSLINTVLGRKNLAQTSNTPGKTRLINFYHINGQPGEGKPWVFVDLPGYGYAKVSKAEQEAWQQNLSEFLLKREPIALVIQLIDARHGPQENDKQMFEWLAHHELPQLVVLTKCDKLKKAEIGKQRDKTLSELGLEADQLVLFSAETKAGRQELQGIIQSLI